MSRIIPISELPKLMDNEAVPAIKGRIKYVGNIYEDNGTYGKYRMQNLEIMAIAPDTGVCKVVIKDRFDWKVEKNQNGKIIYIACTPGEKGPSGVKAKDKLNKKTNKEEREISVTPTAEIVIMDKDEAPSAPTQTAQTSTPAQTTAATQPAQTTAPSQQTAPSQDSHPSPNEQITKQEVLKQAKLMAICIKAADWAIKQSGVPAAPEKVIGVGETLYIDAHRKNLHANL